MLCWIQRKIPRSDQARNQGGEISLNFFSPPLVKMFWT